VNRFFPAISSLEYTAQIEMRHLTAVGPGFQFTHLAELDGFRELAILLVVAGHYFEFHGASGETRDAARGIVQLGVTLFFVLSAFLITGLLCKELAVNLMSIGLITDVPKKELLECLLYYRNLVGRSMSFGLWSLSLKEQFYLVWPLSFLLLPARPSSGDRGVDLYRTDDLAGRGHFAGIIFVRARNFLRALFSF
jgi:peptidoglycan/LPS O-acetylase OafA/YrhL